MLFFAAPYCLRAAEEDAGLGKGNGARSLLRLFAVESTFCDVCYIRAKFSAFGLLEFALVDKLIPPTLWWRDFVLVAAELCLYDVSLRFCLSFSAFLLTILSFESIYRF